MTRIINHYGDVLARMAAITVGLPSLECVC
jgi:hypothetical protein